MIHTYIHTYIYIYMYIPGQRVMSGWPEPDWAHSFSASAQHDTIIERVVPCRHAGPALRPRHRPVSITQVVSCRQPDAPFVLGQPDSYSTFLFAHLLAAKKMKSLIMSPLWVGSITIFCSSNHSGRVRRHRHLLRSRPPDQAPPRILVIPPSDRAPLSRSR
jgi:hypothetical protein